MRKTKKFISFTSIILCVLLIQTLIVYSNSTEQADTLPNLLTTSITSGSSITTFSINIIKPVGWKTKEAAVDITIEPVNEVGNVTVSKVEAKIEKNGSWKNITDDMQIEITENCTVYIQVTDSNGTVYSKSKYIECFDREKPTVNAGFNGQLLRVEANDTLSGVAAVFVNGLRFTNLVNDTLEMRLQDYNISYEKIDIQAVDNAGNISTVYSLKNPYYISPTATATATANNVNIPSNPYPYQLEVVSPSPKPSVTQSISKAPNVIIDIEKPDSWKTKETPIFVHVYNESEPVVISKIEGKIDKNGKWLDITANPVISISENATVYVQVTDNEGNIATKSKYIECFDREKPVVKAYLDNFLLRVEASDNISGVSAVYVNGYKFDELVNNTVDINVKEAIENYMNYDKITVQAVDNAGNKSDTYFVKNPYFGMDAKNNTNVESTPKPTATQVILPTPSVSSTVSNNKPAKSTIQSTPRPISTTENKLTASNPDTPDGNATTIESVTKKDKERDFYTIKTKSNNIFYLVVDKEKSTGNVYLLKEVDETDLLKFVQTADKKDEIKPAKTPEPTPKIEVKPTPQPTAPAQPTPKEAPKSNNSSLLIILLVALGVGGGAYYFKIYKPKQVINNADDLEEFDFDSDDENETNGDDGE